jgi:TonB family protein
VTDRGFRARATHRSARGWTCGIIFARAQPYRSNQAPGQSLCWTAEEKNPRALNVDSLIAVDASDDQVFMESVVEERPEVLSGPAIEYPDLLRQAGVTGRVLVQAIIDRRGRAEPASVKVIQSPNPGFDQPAKNYVLGAMFRPARVHGQTVRVLINLPIDFSIRK